jgi:hypothetical protein
MNLAGLLYPALAGAIDLLAVVESHGHLTLENAY